MKVTVKYHAQARAAAGRASEAIELGESCSVRELLIRLGQRHGEALRTMILTPEGRPHPSILLFVGDEQVRSDSEAMLRDGDVVAMLSPISGG